MMPREPPAHRGTARLRLHVIPTLSLARWVAIAADEDHSSVLRRTRRSLRHGEGGVSLARGETCPLNTSLSPAAIRGKTGPGGPECYPKLLPSNRRARPVRLRESERARISGPFLYSGGGIRTRDLRVMSPGTFVVSSRDSAYELRRAARARTTSSAATIDPAYALPTAERTVEEQRALERWLIALSLKP
jgi:hypothetical protein